MNAISVCGFGTGWNLELYLFSKCVVLLLPCVQPRTGVLSSERRKYVYYIKPCKPRVSECSTRFVK